MTEITSDLHCQVIQRDRKVHVLFSREVEGELRRAETDHLLLDPPAALSMAEALTDMAFEADSGLKPVGETLKASLVERHREKLEPRVRLMLSTMRENSALTHAALARTIIDQVFSEVFS